MSAARLLVFEALAAFQLLWLLGAAVAVTVAMFGEGQGFEGVWLATPLLGTLAGLGLRRQWQRDGRWRVVQSVGWSTARTGGLVAVGVWLGVAPLFVVREAGAMLGLQVSEADWVLVEPGRIQRADGLAVAQRDGRLVAVEPVSAERFLAAHRAQSVRGPLWAAIGQGEPARGARLGGTIARWWAAGAFAALAWWAGPWVGLGVVPWWVLQQILERAGLAGLTGGWSTQLVWLGVGAMSGWLWLRRRRRA